MLNVFSHFAFNFPLLLVVPPLKFGSLVDSKPFSDEESSMITQSMTTEGPKVPLNGKNHGTQSVLFCNLSYFSSVYES